MAGAWSGRREVVLNGSRQLSEDGSAAFERLDRDQGVAASGVSGEWAAQGAVHGRFHAFSSAKFVAVPVPENGSVLRHHPLVTIDVHIQASGSELRTAFRNAVVHVNQVGLLSRNAFVLGSMVAGRRVPPTSAHAVTLSLKSRLLLSWVLEVHSKSAQARSNSSLDRSNGRCSLFAIST